MEIGFTSNISLSHLGECESTSFTIPTVPWKVNRRQPLLVSEWTETISCLATFEGKDGDLKRGTPLK